MIIKEDLKVLNIEYDEGSYKEVGSNDTEIVSNCSRLRARPDRVGFEVYGYKAIEVIKFEAKAKG